MNKYLSKLDDYTYREIYRIVYKECLKQIVPSFIDVYGNFYWEKGDHKGNHQIHRDCCGQPAYIGADGCQQWFRDGQLYREGNRPTIVGKCPWYMIRGSVHLAPVETGLEFFYEEHQ